MIVSLAGLWMVDNQALRSMALGAMTVVAVSILTATTLLPALIAMLGDRVCRADRGRVSAVVPTRRFYRRRTAEEAIGASCSFWDRWTARVMAHPWTAVIGVSAVLLTLAFPLLSIADRDRGARPVPQGQRRAGGQRARLGAARRRRRPGADRRLLRRRRPTGAAVAAFPRGSSATPGVASVAPPAFAADSVL